MILINFFLVVCLISLTNCFTDICYGDLGCYTDRPPYGGTKIRNKGYIPDPPEKIEAKFFLFKKQVENKTISYDSIPDEFDPTLKTKFIVHGFIQNAQRQWMKDMKDAFLRVENLNVITVDWNKGAIFPYAQASANTQIVGAEIARLIKTLISLKGAKMADFHIIGHSLGAHIAGYAGERLEKLGRITGLDPAGPLFEFTDIKVRLDPSDAEFVDIIHTDGASILQVGLGVFESAGHVDFFPNGGVDQPSCAAMSYKLFTAIFHFATSNTNDLEEVSGCSHIAAYKFFTDSIENKNCQYNAYPCSSKAEFDKGNCITCSERGCNKMGYWASPTKDLGNLYLNTQEASSFPFCTENYQARLYSNDQTDLKLKQALGKIKISLQYGERFTNEQIIDDSTTTFKLNQINTYLITINESIEEEIKKVILTYERTTSIFSSWMYDSQWSFKYLELFDGVKQKKLKYCPTKIIMKSGEKTEFVLC